MQSDYEKVTAFEQRKISNDLKIDSWQLFLKNWSDDNPYSQQDEELRSMAESRVVHWQQAPQEMTLYFDWAAGSWKRSLSAYSKSENWKTTRTSYEDPVYVCEVQDGVPNGQGTQTWLNGAKYVGEFKDGLPNGQGTNTGPDGQKYVGEFKDGLLNGQGTLTFPDGRVWSGLWKDDEFLGRK